MCCHRDGADVPAVSFCVSKGIVGYCVGKVSGFLPLLESQSDHRVDFCRPVSWYVHGEERHGSQ